MDYSLCIHANSLIPVKEKASKEKYILKVNSAKVSPRCNQNICTLYLLDDTVSGDIPEKNVKKALKSLVKTVIEFSNEELKSMSEKKIASFLADTPTFVVIPIYLNQHDGKINLATTPSPYDMGLIGWAIRKRGMKEEKSVSLCKEEMKVEIEEYESFLNNECYTLTLCNNSGEAIEKYDKIFYGNFFYFNGMYNFIKTLGFSVEFSSFGGGEV